MVIKGIRAIIKTKDTIKVKDIKRITNKKVIKKKSLNKKSNRTNLNESIMKKKVRGLIIITKISKSSRKLSHGRKMDSATTGSSLTLKIQLINGSRASNIRKITSLEQTH